MPAYWDEFIKIFEEQLNSLSLNVILEAFYHYWKYGEEKAKQVLDMARDKLPPKVFVKISEKDLTSEKVFIGEQAIKINSLEKQLYEMDQNVKKVRSLITCIGGPMNDNIDLYNHKQLQIFAKILQVLE